MASPGNQHCANCIGTLPFAIGPSRPVCLKMAGQIKFAFYTYAVQLMLLFIILTINRLWRHTCPKN